ncbi:MAG: AmmeMemoRadiSam system radical SAM enzyme [Deltaproteobacteria bacterium]|nr:AmmeMemoRadiSam system radical SAM enzyme [Deltaproteobacteria bacterium]
MTDFCRIGAELRSLCGWRCSRRRFIQAGASALTLLSLPVAAGAASGESRHGFIRPHPAQYYRKLDGGLVECQLCPRTCEVLDGDRGECGVRENRQGKYFSLTYGNPCAVHVDPVEKKPLFHVLPGSGSFSIATAGCNLHCKFCQNWEISQTRPDKTYNFDLPPEKVVELARRTNCASIAHTYVEPVIFYEYMMDVGRLAKKAGILNVCHSAGYVNEKPLEALCEVLDAACIDLKSFEADFYRELVGAELDPVLGTLKTLRRRGVHVEIVNLVIPQMNDKPEAVTRMCAWIRDELGPHTPLHFSRFYPLYKMLHHYPTPVSTLEKVRDLALKAGLKYVYIGNIPGNKAESTFCHSCGKLIIARKGYMVGEVLLKDGKCAHCGAKIPGIWDKPKVV